MELNGKGQVNIRNYEFIDLSFLNTMAEGNQLFVVEMLQMFNEQTLELIEQLKEAMEKSDLDKVRFFVHKYKSSVSLVGNPDLQDLLHEIEVSIKKAVRLEHIPSLVDKVFLITSGILNDVSEELNTLD